MAWTRLRGVASSLKRGISYSTADSDAGICMVRKFSVSRRASSIVSLGIFRSGMVVESPVIVAPCRQPYFGRIVSLCRPFVPSPTLASLPDHSLVYRALWHRAPASDVEKFQVALHQHAGLRPEIRGRRPDTSLRRGSPGRACARRGSLRAGKL